MASEDILYKLLQESNKEKSKQRRWGMFKFLIIIAIIVTVAVMSFTETSDADGVMNGKKGDQIAVIDFIGVISYDTGNYKTLVKGLKNALKDKKTKAVIIRANSPGGSPVYSDLVYNEIIRLRKAYPNIPIDFVTEEVCASGCYYAASAANDIYVAPASIVGSIGVIKGGFGFVDTIKKLGVENRLMTSGENKAMGYPFLPKNKKQMAMEQDMLDKIHIQFINAVESGRKGKLKNNKDLFSGRYWVGSDAIALGLADGYASVDSLARDKYHSDNLVDFTPQNDIFDKLGKKFGVAISSSAQNMLLKNGFTGMQ